MTTLSPPFETRVTCRSCGGGDLAEIIAFGDTPIADRLVPLGHGDPQFTAPLTLVRCRSCTMCQIKETVAPKVLFPADYPYYSSVSPALIAHFRESAMDLMRSGVARPGMRVIEAASNDGYLLETFLQNGLEVLGVDPADGPVSVARSKGIETVCDFFGHGLAKEIRETKGAADVFLANNVLAHVADTNDFVAGIAEILSDEGIAVIECPYLIDMVQNCAFDTIYHQHLLFLSLTSLNPLFERHGLYVNDVLRLKIHGGSLRLFISRNNDATERCRALLASEAILGLNEEGFFDEFVARIDHMKVSLCETIKRLKSSGKRIAGYGAAAKATTLMHHFGFETGDIEFIVDKSPWKHGMEMPVTGIPIVGVERLQADRPDVLVILAWNFANEIISENRAFIEAGGTFLVPVPELREVAADFAGVSL